MPVDISKTLSITLLSKIVWTTGIAIILGESIQEEEPVIELLFPVKDSEPGIGLTAVKLKLSLSYSYVPRLIRGPRGFSYDKILDPTTSRGVQDDLISGNIFVLTSL